MNLLKGFVRNRHIFRRACSKSVTWPEEPLYLPTAEGGGFYAPTLGQTLNSRYTVIRKLGWGQHSSVWLVRDIQERQRPCYAAVKILTSHATQVQGRLANELAFLQHIKNVSSSSGHAGRNHVSNIQDTFQVADTHGNHLCLVYQAMGSFASGFQGQSKRLPVPLVKSVARQLCLALDFLHRECDIIHTDIKPDNLLIKLNNTNCVLGPDIEGPTLSSNDAPSPAVLSRPIIPFTPSDLVDTTSVPDFNIQLTDFGTAAEINGFHADVIQPSALRAPEVIIGCGWDASADIWNVGCLIFEFLTGSRLFVPRGGPTWTPEAYHLAHMPGVSGDEFDVSHLQGGKHYAQYFEPDGHLHIQVRGVRDLETALRSYNVLSESERPLCVSLLKAMLRLKPSDRATAAELAQHEWLK